MAMDKFQKLLDKVYRFISFRPRSEKEVSLYLKKRKISLVDQEKIFALLKEQKLLDDEGFVHWWIEQRAAFRPKGKRGLTYELRQKGIDRNLVQRVLNQTVDEFSLASAVFEKKKKNYQNLLPEEFRQKIIAILARRGFSWETIKKVLDKFSKKQ